MFAVIVSKIKKRVLPNITFILNELTQYGIIFISIGLFPKIKKQRKFDKHVVF